MEIAFSWEGFNENEFSRIKEQIQTGRNDLDWVGNVRAGELCFDLVARHYTVEEGKSSIEFDCYVGGEDKYSETLDGYPYDWAGGGCAATFEEIKSMDYESFQTQVEKRLLTFISDTETAGYSLAEKAVLPLHKW